MELLTFVYGIIITIISVITVEYFLNYFKEKKEVKNHKCNTEIETPYPATEPIHPTN